MGEPITVGEGRQGGNRRVLLLAGIAAAVLLAVVVLPGLLFGGDDAPVDDSFTPVDPGPAVTTVPEEAPPAETFEPFTSKNPFRPLVAVETPAEDPGEDPGGDVPPETFPPSEDDPTFVDDEFDEPVDDGDVDGADPSTTTTTVAGPPPRQPDRVSLLEVFTDQGGQVVASVRVNDTTHQVGEGDEFATSYRVLDLDISTRCGQFLFGDDRFRLCENEETFL